jgi:hypothetical protein
MRSYTSKERTKTQSFKNLISYMGTQNYLTVFLRI